ncbi:MAG: hypothetical protein ACR2L6_09630 [Gemmatimonadaceae bacterium]
MPPNLDIYVLTRRRDSETIDRFLDAYVDRAANEDRRGGELCMLALDAPAGAEDQLDPAEWVPVASLAEVIAHGLARPSRAFVCHLKPRVAPFNSAYLAFTRDDRLVLGLSMDDWDMLPERQAEAERVMNHLMSEFEGDGGLVAVEMPPPLSAASFAAARGPLITARAMVA